MINPFKPGDKKIFERLVVEADTAIFDSGTVHPVFATFALGRDAEWACRLFVLEIKESHEEGIGTFLNVVHHSPAHIGSIVRIESILDRVEKNEVICSFEARVGKRLVASGKTGQKILNREKLNRLFEEYKSEQK